MMHFQRTRPSVTLRAGLSPNKHSPFKREITLYYLTCCVSVVLVALSLGSLWFCCRCTAATQFKRGHPVFFAVILILYKCWNQVPFLFDTKLYNLNNFLGQACPEPFLVSLFASSTLYTLKHGIVMGRIITLTCQALKLPLKIYLTKNRPEVTCVTAVLPVTDGAKLAFFVLHSLEILVLV